MTFLNFPKPDIPLELGKLGSVNLVHKTYDDSYQPVMVNYPRMVMRPLFRFLDHLYFWSE